MTDEEIEFKVRSCSEKRIDYCPYHRMNTTNIELLTGIVNTHKGQWRVLFWGGLFFASSFMTLATIQYQSSEKTVATVVRMDKTFTAYMTMHGVQSINGFERISELEGETRLNREAILKLDSRVRTLEINK